MSSKTSFGHSGVFLMTQNEAAWAEGVASRREDIRQAQATAALVAEERRRKGVRLNSGNGD